MSEELVEIGSGTVLRSRREDITLRTSDGLSLVGELALPAVGEPVATLVTFHPLPTHGGFMDSHIFRKAANRLPALAGFAVLRFNTRGTSSPRGKSEGVFGEGVSEEFDVAAALDFVRERGLPNPWLVGWSFGTELVLKFGLSHAISGAVLLSPPLHRAGDADLARWAAAGVPLTVLVPEFDDFLPPAAALPRFSRVPQARFVAVQGGRHLWTGERQTRRVLDEIVQAVGGVRVPLPTVVPVSLLA